MITITNDEVKQYLGQAYCLHKSIKAKGDKIVQLRDRRTKITADNKADVVQGGKLNTGFADLTNEILALETQIHAEFYKQVKAEEDICERIYNMADDYPKLALILELRYINYMTWEQVCVELSMTWSHVVGELHIQALEKFKNYLPTE